MNNKDFKVCTKCNKGVMSYSSYFNAYSCNECDNFETVNFTAQSKQIHESTEIKTMLSEKKYIDADFLLKKAFKSPVIDDKNTFYEMSVVPAVSIKITPATDIVSGGTYRQTAWERDVAVDQLNSYGVELGEKADCIRIVRCKDCKHRYENLPDHWCKYVGVADYDSCNLGEHKV